MKTRFVRRLLPLSLCCGAALGMAACGDDDGGVGPGRSERVFVASDPPGARILLDGRNTGRRTPDTIAGLRTRHDVAVRLDTLGIAYGFLARVDAVLDSVPTVIGPLVMRCGNDLCWENHHRFQQAGRLRFASNPVGSLFMRQGRGEGITWPNPSRNTYVSAGVPVFAAVTDHRDTVALGIYDLRYFAGRPTPIVAPSGNGGEVLLEQSTWILPPVDALTYATVRGIEIEQRVVADPAHEDVAIVQLVFRNISNSEAYAAADPIVAPGGINYESAFIGFALDPDIGIPQSSEPDWVSYEPSLNLVFAYDANLRVTTGFDGEGRNAPGLVGLRVLDAPPGTRVVLNAWAHAGGSGTADWRAGFANERAGWGMLSGTQPYLPAHPDTRIGHLPQAPGDMRISVSVGPVRLRPGDEAALAVAVILATPVAGTFTSGNPVEPGDPMNANRPLARIAAELFAKAAAAESAAQAQRAR